MKNKIFLLFLGWLCIFTMKAQSDSSLNDELRHLLKDIAPSHCSSPFLYDLAAHTSDSSYYLPIDYTDTNSWLNWWQIYFEMYHSSYTPNLLTDDTTAMDAMEQIQDDSDAVYLGLMDFDFNAIRGDAWDSVNYGRWFFYNDDSIWDNPHRADEPFITNPVDPGRGECNEIFNFSPLRATSYFRDVTFRFSPGMGNHWFYDAAYSANIDAHPTPHRFQIDFGDGNGFIDVDPFSDFNSVITYPDSGDYYLTAHVIKEGNVIKSSTSRIRILTPSLKIYPDAIFVKSGAEVSLFRNDCHQDTLFKPIIYVQGIEVYQKRTASQIFDQMIHDNRIQALKNFQYDIFIVKWNNTKLDMHENAQTLRGILDELKLHCDSTNQFIVIGESMGGVIARETLCIMESADYQLAATLHAAELGIFKPHLLHNTRLLITLDSPHKGANVPLAFQHAADWVATIGKNVVRTAFTISYFVNAWKKYERFFLQADAVKQLLILHKSTRNGSGEYTHHSMRQDYMDNLLSMGNKGWPVHCKTMALSNGLLDGAHQQKYQDAGDAGGGENLVFFDNFSVSVRLLRLIPLPILIHNNIKIAAAPSSGSGNIFHVPPGFTMLVGIRGCFVNFLRRKSFCGMVATPDINVDVQNVPPIDVMPGGSEVAGALFIEPLDDEHMRPVAFGVFETLDADPWAGTFKMKVKTRLLNTWAFKMQGSSDIPRNCFIPLQSAFDYTDTTGSIGDDFDIGSESVATNMSRTPVDVIIGWGQDSSCLHSTSHTYHFDFYDGLACKNTAHLNWRIDFTSTFIGLPTPRNYICREIGDDWMWLDNMNMNRASLYEAALGIEAGINRNWYYDYDGFNFGPGFRLGNMQSKSKPFEIDSFDIGQVEFKAGSSIDLLNGFHCKHGGKFWAHIDSTHACNLDWPDLNQGSSDGIVAEDPLTIAKTNTKETVSLFPNPTEGIFTVKADRNPIVAYKIMNLRGQIVTDTKGFTPENSVIIRTPLPAGIYWLQVTLGDGSVASRSFIIE